MFLLGNKLIFYISIAKFEMKGSTIDKFKKIFKKQLKEKINFSDAIVSVSQPLTAATFVPNS
jgi:hypothetical protein